MTAPLIEVKNLAKTYHVSERAEGFWGSVKGLFKRRVRPVEAVKSVSFSIQPGELVAFLGPNGAGKTTTLKMLSGLLYPTGGEIRVLGHVPFDKKNDFLNRFSFVMGQRHQLWWELPAVDTFRLNAAVFSLSSQAFKNRLKELDDLLDLDPLWNTPVKKLSLGQRMKMELACSLIHNPELLLLDEPTIGLDVVMQKTLRDFIERVNREKGTTVLLTSHNMEDIETLCRRVIVIHHGILLFDGELTDLVNRFVPAKFVSADLLNDPKGINFASFGRVMNVSGTRIQWEIPREDISRGVAAILKELPVKDLTVEEMPLDEVVRRIFREGSV
ncbi:MAG: Vitamin B12 import ATP-binding protein BtuD [Elusimicrobia bacterium]|nr:Vitamin B12 import ATP-binding protein BtuD [Elusimicrobiota bacterium]